MVMILNFSVIPLRQLYKLPPLALLLRARQVTGGYAFWDFIFITKRKPTSNAVETARPRI